MTTAPKLLFFAMVLASSGVPIADPGGGSPHGVPVTGVLTFVVH